MTLTADSLPNDIETLKAMVIAAHAARLNAEAEVRKVANGLNGHGLDARNGTSVDLIKAGIIDPVKVVRTALQDAASVSALLITTEAMVAERPKKDAGPAMPGGGGMGGMGDMDF